MISKLLVANRGEIAIRAFRAAYEMGIATVAVYAYEDRNSSHRLKADESYQIGETGRPVRAYLSVDEIIRVAKHAGADAVYPGYGFLSENPELAAACAEAGITFVGPGAHVLELTGNKARAIAAAQEAGLPVLDVVGAVGVGGRARRRRRGHAVPVVRQGGVRRRWARDEAGGRTRGAGRGDRGRQPRGRVGVRRSDGLPRAGRAEPAPHRGADPGRRPGQRHPPLRAGLQRAAPPPEGDRARARAESARRAAGRRSAPTPSRSPGRSTTPARAPWSSCSTSAAITCSSR